MSLRCLQAFPVNGRLGGSLTAKATFESSSEIVFGAFTALYTFGLGKGLPSHTVRDVQITELPPKAGIKGKLFSVSFVIDSAEPADSAYWVGEVGNEDGEVGTTNLIAVNISP